MINQHSFKETYFKEELMRFRQLMGDKSFWAKTQDQKDLAIKGLAFIYFNVEPDNGGPVDATFIQQMADLYQNTMNEYARRQTMMDMLSLKKYLKV